ncbi:MAG: peptidoglycan DD-metalloendopeptidase family protein [Proteobacteria bacterium]|nr:peptidoglycan DD-metalloendopeptidase family protein [Pseudomonadota bacterium]
MLFIAKTVFKKLIVLAVLLLFFPFFGNTQGSEASPEMGVVVSSSLHIREKADKDSDSIGTLSKGRLVRVVAHTKNGWLEIEDSGRKGFIRDRERYIHVFREKSKKKNKRTVTSKMEDSPKGDVELEIEEHNQELQSIDTKIKQHQEEIREFSEKEMVILNGLNEIDRALSDSRTKLVSIKKEMGGLEAEIKNNTSALKDLEQVIEFNERYIAKRLVSLYKLNQIGKMNVLASADSVYDLLGRRRAMEFILKADDQVLSDHLNNLSRLTDLKTRLSEQKAINISLESAYSRQIEAIERNREKKTALRDEIRRKRSLGLAAIQSLKDAARELDQTIQALDQGFERNPGGRGSSGSHFFEKKGLLKMPVNGKISSLFGKSTDNEFKVETFQSGINVLADRGDPIQAVAEGQVLFADWLKGYGNLIIIDHGDNYYSLYGHTEEVFKKKGDRVEDREVIATVGDTGSLSSPALHFEIRHKGEPLDPLSWLKKS